MTKQLLAAFQTEVLDEHGSDCKSKYTIDVTITEKSIKDFQYRYIMEGGKPVCLTPEVISKYVGKTVKLRSPIGCKSEKICNICGGELDYLRGNVNIGLGCLKISTTLQRLGMKEFHIAKVKSHEINLDDIFI